MPIDKKFLDEVEHILDEGFKDFPMMNIGNRKFIRTQPLPEFAREVDTVDDEDLEAAADFYDRLIDKQKGEPK